MWPQFLALLPHITRLLPAVDRYLQNRAAADKAQEATLTTMSRALREELGHLTEAQAGMHRQLQEQTGQLATLVEEFRRTRSSLESTISRADAAELQLTTLNRWLRFAGIAILVLLGVLILLVAQLIHAVHTH